MELSKLMGCVKRPFIPSELFRGGLIDGAWFDPSDLSTLYQDAAGTTPVTAVEQPVGLMLDKARGLMLGPEKIINGNFSSAASWTLNGASITTGRLDFNASATQYIAFQDNGLNYFAVGRSYVVELDYSTNVYANVYIDGNNAGTIPPGVGHFKCIYKALSTVNGRLQINTQAAGVGWIDNISVRELYGYHATQSVTASRPTLSARYNLLTKTEDFANAAWDKTNYTQSQNADGSYLLTRGNTTAQARVFQNISAPVGTSFTLSAKVKIGSTGSLFGMRVQGTYPNRVDAVINLLTGDITYSGGVTYTLISASSKEQDGCYIVSVSGIAVNTGITNIAIGAANTSNGTWESISSSLLDFNVYYCNLNFNIPALPYQRVNTASDYDTDERYFKKYLRFDGVDDYLTLGDVFDIGIEGVSIAASVILFNATISPIAGKSRAASDGGRYFLGTESSAFLLASHNIEPPANIAYSQSIGESVVLSAKLGPHGARYLSLYKNAALINSRDTALTTSSYDTNNPFWIGAYPNSSGTTPAYGYLNGGIYGLIITKSALTDAQRIACERHLSRKSGVQL